MNNTSNSDSKAKIIVIIASLIVILAIALALTFILKQHQNKAITETTESNTKQHEHYEQQNVDKDIKTSVKDSTYREAITEEADQTSDGADSVGDMNGDTTTGVEITDKMKEYTESQESTVTEEDNTAEWTEEPKQEEVYVPAAEPEVDNTTTSEPTPVPEDNNNSGSDDSFWGSDGDFNTSGIDVDTGGYEDTAGWTAGGTWSW